jgi:hypothetical protein
VRGERTGVEVDKRLEVELFVLGFDSLFGGFRSRGASADCSLPMAAKEGSEGRLGGAGRGRY